jgi:hypothetical protein
MKLILALNSMKGIKEKLLQTHRWKIERKYSGNHKKEKWSIQLGDEIHAQWLAILTESNIYKVWKQPQHHSTLWRIGGISHFLSSPLLSYTMKHTHTSQKGTIARRWERDEWVLASPPALGVLFIGKLITILHLWPNTTKMVKLG